MGGGNGGREDSILWLSLAFLVAVKLLLMDSYSSTDLEVHRNWMAITDHCPLAEWYTEKTSESTLDYPPFFAYLEKFVSVIARSLGFSDILSLQSTPLLTRRVRIFMRLSVIVADLFFALSCILLYRHSQGWKSRRCCFGVSLLLLTHTSFVLLDNIHFQYNAFLTSLLLLSFIFISRGSLLLAAFAYAVLLNFKHIYLYYAPGYVIFYLIGYFSLEGVPGCKVVAIIKRGVVLGMTLAVPFVVSLAPFVWSGGPSQLVHILSRLFPIQRGLTHAFWAPNAWAIYNSFDLLLFRLATLLHFSPPPPEYTSGLVQEYSHSVLPSVGVGFSLVALFLSLFPLLGLLRRPPFPLSSSLSLAALSLLLSAFSFFLFGYHVHEKAILLLLVPMIVLAGQHAFFAPLLLDVTVITSGTLAPLLFSLPERPLRLCFLLTQLVATVLFCNYVHSLPLRSLISPLRRLLIALAIFMDVYACFIHERVLGDCVPFVPLLAISVLHALWLVGVWLRLVVLVFPSLLVLPRRLLFLRNGSSLSSPLLSSSQQVEVVIGVDIACSRSDPSLAAVVAVIYDYRTGELLKSVHRLVIMDLEYIPHWLALTEAEPVASLLRDILPDLNGRRAVVFCDGNGDFHPRQFGLACHVAFLSGLPSVGISKNFDYGVVQDNENKKLHAIMKKVLAGEKGRMGRASCDVVLPVRLHIIFSPSPLFVSAGLGISLQASSDLVLSCVLRGIHPVLQADNLARQIVNDGLAAYKDKRA